MKRFYTEVTVTQRTVLLDTRPVRTPLRAALRLPTDALAAAIADEWRVISDEIDPRAMPLTGLANAAVDQVAPDCARFVDELATYAQSDMLCYRAAAPPELAAHEAACWDPLLDWARARYHVAFTVIEGVVHRPQPRETLARLTAAVASRDAFALAALSPLVTIGGSLVAALMIDEDAITADAAFAATHLDELWQRDRWGEDALAAQARTARQADFVAAARFLVLARSL